MGWGTEGEQIEHPALQLDPPLGSGRLVSVLNGSWN